MPRKPSVKKHLEAAQMLVIWAVHKPGQNIVLNEDFTVRFDPDDNGGGSITMSSSDTGETTLPGTPEIVAQFKALTPPFLPGMVVLDDEGNVQVQS